MCVQNYPWSCPKVVVCCGAGAVTAPAPTPTAEPTPKPTLEPTPTLPCKKALVRIDSIHVTKAEDFGFWGEPGANAEWRLTVTVNDQSKTWSHDYVKDGMTFTLGWDFPVELINESTTISIKSSGYEEDDSSANDPLPPAERTHGSADNWGIGATRQLSASNADFHYTINYTVTCLARAAKSVISRQAVVGVVKARLKSRGVETRKTDDELVTTFINKMAARGIELTEALPELLVWEGPSTVQKMISEVFPVEEEADKEAKK